MHPRKKYQIGIRAVGLAAAWIISTAVGTPVLGADVHSGRATGATVVLVNPSPNTLVFADTGELPSNGGSLSEGLVEISVGVGTLSSSTVTATTVGSGQMTTSSASQENVVVFEGQPAELTASVIRSDAVADCAGAEGSSIVTDLVFGGNSIVVTGEPNQTVTIPSVATLVINEQIPGSGNEITVHAIHLTLGTGEEVMLSTSRAGISCPVPAESASWSRLKQRY